MTPPHLAQAEPGQRGLSVGVHAKLAKALGVRIWSLQQLPFDLVRDCNIMRLCIRADGADAAGLIDVDERIGTSEIYG